jgi:hypothetical protein
MKTKNFLMLMAVAGMLILASCKEDDPSPLTAEQAQAELPTVNTEYTDIKGTYDVSDAAQMQSYIDDSGLPFDAPMRSPSSLKNFKTKVIKVASPSFAKTLSDNGDFLDIDWDSNVGTYSWNSSTLLWDHTTSPTDQIVITFPYSDGTATLTYYDYSTKTYTYDLETYTYVSSLSFKAEYTPTGGSATTVFSWEYTASMSSYDKGNFKFVYTLGDFSQTENYSIGYSTGSSYVKVTVSMLFEVSYQGEIIFGQYATVVMKITQDGYSYAIDAKIRVKNIIVKWNIDLNETTDTSDPNNYMTISVWTTGGAKVADVEMIYDSTTEDYVPWLVYDDGTKEKVSDKFGSEDDSDSLMYLIGDFVDGLMSFMSK